MRRILAPLIVVAALAAALFWWDLPSEKREEQAQQDSLRLTQLDPALVDTLRIVDGPRRTEVIRRSGDWWITRPLEERADDASVQGILNSLCRVGAVRIVSTEVDTTALDAYGLGGLRPAQRFIEMRAPGREPVVYDLGRNNPTGQAVYLRVRGRTEVALVEIGVSELGRVNHQAFRIYDLFDVETEAIAGISVSSSRGEFTATRDARGLWSSGEASPRPLLRQPLHQLAYDLAHARVRKYLADELPEEDFAAYGLSDPMLTVEFVAPGMQHRIDLGNESEENGLPFGRRDLNATLLITSGELLAAAELDLEDLIDTNPVRDNYALLDSVRVTWHSGESITAFPGHRREWDLRPPPGWHGEPDHFLVSAANLIRGVEELRSDESVELSDSDAADEYLAVRRIRCELFWPDRTVSYEIGWRRGEDAHWLQIEGEARVHRIPRDLFFRLRGALLSAQLIDGGS